MSIYRFKPSSVGAPNINMCIFQCCFPTCSRLSFFHKLIMFFFHNWRQYSRHVRRVTEYVTMISKFYTNRIQNSNDYCLRHNINLSFVYSSFFFLFIFFQLHIKSTYFNVKSFASNAMLLTWWFLPTHLIKFTN